MSDETLIDTNDPTIESINIIKQFEPEKDLLVKKELIKTTILSFCFAIFLILCFLPFAFDSLKTFYVISLVILVLMVVFMGVSWWLIKLYVDSMKFYLTEKEIIKDIGIITKSRKIVPYRTITNFNQKIGPFDRIIGGPNFGTIIIETAGISGQTLPEQTLKGIADVSQYIATIRGIIGKTKGQAAVVADEDDEVPSTPSEDGKILKEILKVLKDISKKMK